MGKGLLPDYMLGKFQLETSEGFSDFMYKIGVGWFNRALACTAYPIITITEKTESSFKTSTKSFRLNEIYTKTNQLGDGVQVTARLQGNKLIRDTNLKGYDFVFTSEYLEGGSVMNMIITIKGDSEFRVVRGFKRLDD